LHIFYGLLIGGATLAPWRADLNYPSEPFGTIFVAFLII